MYSSTPSARVVVAITVLSAIAACGGGNSSPAPPTTPPGSGVVQVTGTEKIGWDQSAVDLADLQSFSYVVFVDGVQGALNGASCGSSAGTNGYPCTAPLPPLTNGQHTLQLATVRTSGGASAQSDPSPALTVLKVGLSSSSTSTSARGREPLDSQDLRNVSGADPRTSGVNERSGTDRVAVIADHLHQPTAIAATPDGRIFVAEAERVLVIENGALRPEPSLVLAADGAAGEAGWPDLTVDPGFSSNHVLWLSRVVEDDSRRVVRITRYTEAGGNFGASAIVAELPVHDTAGRTRIRIGPDGKLYVSIADRTASTDRDAAYEGSILRLERDGTTPRDNPAQGPVLSSGHGNLQAIAWPSGSADMWGVEAHAGASTIEALPLLVRSLDAGRTSVSGPRRFSVAAAPDLTGFDFVPGAAALTAVAASPQTQSLYRLTWEGDRLLTPVGMLSGRFGAIREVNAAPDGSIYATTANQPDADGGRGDLLIRVVLR